MEFLVKYLVDNYGYSPEAAADQARVLLSGPSTPEVQALLEKAAIAAHPPPKAAAAKPSFYYSVDPATLGQRIPTGHTAAYSAVRQPPRQPQQSQPQPPAPGNPAAVVRQQLAQQQVQSLHSALVARGVDPAAAAQVATKLLAPGSSWLADIDFGPADQGGQ